VQELALSRLDPILQLGPRNLPWNAFHKYLLALRLESDRHKAANDWPFWSQYAFWQASRAAVELGDIRAAANITFQLDSVNDLQATDRRDIVYGVLGISTYKLNQRPITIDYSESVRRVFLEASCSMLSGKVLPYRWFPLHLPSDDTPRSAAAPLGLPTWALNLSIRSRTFPTTDEKNIPSRFWDSTHTVDVTAHGDQCLPPRLRFSDDLERLYTIGMHMGTISVTSVDLFYESGSAGLNWREVASRLQQIHDTMLLPRNIAPDCYRKEFTTDPRSSIDLKAFMAIISGDYSAEQLHSNSNSPSTDDLLNSVKNTLRLLQGSTNRIILATEEGRVAAIYHPDPLTGV
jgi:hypothetical protein